MKKILFILATLLSFKVHAECNPPINVDIVIMDFNYTIDHSHSIAELTKLMKEQNEQHPKKSVDFGMIGNVNRVAISSVDLNCSSFNVSVDIGYKDSVLYIAKELKPGSCAYNAIQAHEEGHLAIYREFLNKAKLKINEYIINKYSKIPAFEESYDYQTIIEQDIKQYVFNVLAQVSKEQEEFDISEKNKTSKVCHGALLNLANSFVDK